MERLWGVAYVWEQPSRILQLQIVRIVMIHVEHVLHLGLLNAKHAKTMRKSRPGPHLMSVSVQMDFSQIQLQLIVRPVIHHVLPAQEQLTQSANRVLLIPRSYLPHQASVNAPLHSGSMTLLAKHVLQHAITAQVQVAMHVKTVLITQK